MKQVFGPLNGLVFCFTGELVGWTRVQAVEAITALGAEYSGTVTKRTTHVVVGTEPGVKPQSAIKYGCTIFYETQFAELLRTKSLLAARLEPLLTQERRAKEPENTLPRRRAFWVE